MNLKIKNIVTVDTSKETTVTNNGYPAFSIEKGKVYEHRDYYIRVTVKHTNASFTIRNCMFYINAGLGSHFTIGAPSDNTEFIASGVLSNYSSGNIKTDSPMMFYWAPRPMSNEEQQRTITTTYKEVVCIDITDLERDFPYFASLSDEEKKTLLDEALPFINGGETFKFNGVLRNWINPADNKTDWSDGISDQYELALLTYRYGKIIGKRSFLYGRFDFKYSTDNSTENYMWCSLFADAGTLDYVEIAYPSPDRIYSASAFQRVLYNLVHTGTKTGLYAGTSDRVQGKTCYWRRIIVLDLYQDGAYLFFRLLGMSDDDIKAYLDTIPFFADTYSIGPAYLDKAGLEYYHSKILQMISSLSTSALVQTVSANSEDFSLKDVRSIAYGLNRFVAVGSGGKGAYSTDEGVTWHLFEDMKLDDCQTASVSYGDGTFIAIGSNGKVSRSTDGITWSSIENTAIPN